MSVRSTERDQKRGVKFTWVLASWWQVLVFLKFQVHFLIRLKLEWNHLTMQTSLVSASFGACRMMRPGPEASSPAMNQTNFILFTMRNTMKPKWLLWLIISDIIVFGVGGHICMLQVSVDSIKRTIFIMVNVPSPASDSWNCHRQRQTFTLLWQKAVF